MVGGTQYVESAAIQANTTVRLSESVTLANGKILPKGSIVTVSDDAMKVVLPDGTSSISSYSKAMTPSKALPAPDTTVPGKTIQVDSKGNALIGEWTSTKTLSSPENALQHWNKHGTEFPQYTNTSQYIAGAQTFVSSPPAGTLIKIRSNGDVLIYEPKTNTFAVKASTGEPRTMFKPDPAKHGYPTNLDYFNAQK